MSEEKIEGTAKAWEVGKLGRDELHAKPSDLKMEDLDGVLSLQMISTRIQKELLDDLKALAQYHGIGYQTLMRRVLRRLTDAEMRCIAREAISEADHGKHRPGSDPMVCTL